MATVWILFALIPLAQAQNSAPANEVYLSFQYQGVVGKYVTTYYKEGQFYLPVSELFSILKIDHNVNQGTLNISGIYLGDQEYVLDFKNQVTKHGDQEIQLQAEDFLIKEIDYFLRPEIFENLFGLSFSTDFNNLALDLETTDKMPVVAQYEREEERKKLNRDQNLYNRSFHPLQYDRNYSSLDGAFLDYNLSAIYSNSSQLFTFSNAIGAEFLGGDVQGNIFGAFSGEQSSITTSGLRWRYVQRDSDLFSSVIAGQTNSEGITSRAITGVKISNMPVEPRLLFDRFPIEGNVPAQSEVELYLNNRLIDYQEADESGNYRFLVPLTYGSTNYSVRIYTPSGQAIERNARIQIPFDFLPPGQVDYSLSGGQLENPILGSTERGYMGEASVSTGLTNWLTAKASAEYLTQYHTTLPSVTATLNARLFSNYLVSANINSENFYRLTSSVVYSNGASWNLSYNYNPGNSQLYNVGGSDHLGRASIFTPFQIGNIPLNIRWSSTYQLNGPTPLLRYRADLSTRLGRLNVRLGYTDQQSGALSFETSSASRITNSYTYSIGRYNSIPKLLRGLFIRGNLTYLPEFQQLEEVEFQLSRNLMQTGRLQLTYGHNFVGGFNSLSLNITVDFNKFRSNTTSRATASELSISQNIRGSVGYDPYGNQFLLSNRQQVGQSGAAVRLFVDNNNDGTYQDSTDDIINDPAVRVNRAGGQNSIKDGVNYISQLLPYYRYNLEINKGALSNPLLVPDVENFSIITDPNQYKTIEIPFYLSGVISGKVSQKKDSTLSGLGGVRLYLKSDYENSSKREAFTKELRTFSDGSFYTYEIPPGKYQLFIDPNQLEFLNSVSEPDTMDIEVKSLAQGDFIEGLNFTVSSPSNSTDEQATSPIIATSQTDQDSLVQDKSELSESNLNYEIQLASFKTRRKAESYAKEAAQVLGGAFSVIQNTSNDLYAIRGLPISHRDQAVETILSYHNSKYKSAALVVMKNRSKKPITRRSKFIQIGAFSTEKRAETFATKSAQKLSQETAITYNRDLELYKVYLNKKFSSDTDRLVHLGYIKKLYSFNKAYINRRNRVQIGAFRNQRDAEFFAKQSKELLNRSIEVTYDSLDYHTYNVQLAEEYTSNAERYNILAAVRRTPSPFSDAFVSTLNYEDSGIDTPNARRAMKFTYQVEIEGVTQETEQAFISAVTDQNNDVQLKRPKKNTITFEDVATWNQAQQLQRKLSKVSTIGYPIVILIEEN